jgi:DNA polymerase sigma
MSFDRKCLGDLLMSFLQLYGTQFDYLATGISVTEGG